MPLDVVVVWKTCAQTVDDAACRPHPRAQPVEHSAVAPCAHDTSLPPGSDMEGGNGVGPTPLLGAARGLHQSVKAVAGVAEPGNDVPLFVEPLVNARDDD